MKVEPLDSHYSTQYLKGEVALVVLGNNAVLSPVQLNERDW